MKIIKKANVNSNALTVPSEAADKLGIVMKVFIRKNMNTLKETLICSIQFRDDKGGITQTEDIIATDANIGNLYSYSSKLKKDIPTIVNIDGKDCESSTNCIKDLKKFLRNKNNEIPVRLYYNKGYGWSYEEINGEIRFDGSSIAGLGDIILDDHEHHLTKKGEQDKIIGICNEVMHDRVSTQFLLATSLAAPIFGALDLKSLLVNICGKSSQGKTTIMKLCISLWTKSSDENLNTTWYNTENAICARLNGLEGVLFILDDTSQGNNKNFTNIAYNIEDGKSKGRLNKLFIIDNVATWHTCILSGSESSMYEKTDKEKNGILRRLVEIDVVQGDLLENEGQAQKVDKITKENYGHVGMSLVNKLFENGLTNDRFEKLNNYLNNEQGNLQNNIDGSGISKGLAGKLAVVLLAAKLGKEYLGLEFDINELKVYIQGLIVKSEIRANNCIIDKMDINTIYDEVCKYAEENLDDRFKTDFEYHIPVALFN